MYSVVWEASLDNLVKNMVSVLLFNVKLDSGFFPFCKTPNQQCGEMFFMFEHVATVGFRCIGGEETNRPTDGLCRLKSLSRADTGVAVKKLKMDTSIKSVEVFFKVFFSDILSNMTTDPKIIPVIVLIFFFNNMTYICVYM